MKKKIISRDKLHIKKIVDTQKKSFKKILRIIQYIGAKKSKIELKGGTKKSVFESI